MKFHKLSIFALLFLMLGATACGPARGRELSDYPYATTGDSMMYYYAQLRAHEYWKAAINDTTLRNPEQRRQYIEGVKAGIDAIKMDSKYDAYNRGVRRGAQMGIRFLYFEDTYGIELNEKILIESLTYGLESEDYDVPEFQYQNEFYRLYDRVKAQHRDETRDLSQASLEVVASDLGLDRVTDDLYYRITRPGTGHYPHKGNVVYSDIEYERADGSNLGMPSPERLTLGAPGMPEVMEMAYLQMNVGSSATFATTAEAVFGQRSEIIGMRPDEVLIVKIKLKDIGTAGIGAEYEHPTSC